jgi:hypothetical protein
MWLCDARFQQPDVILKLNLEVIAAEPADAANTPFRARSMSNEVALFMCHFTPVCSLGCERLCGAPASQASLLPLVLITVKKREKMVSPESQFSTGRGPRLEGATDVRMNGH